MRSGFAYIGLALIAAVLAWPPLSANRAETPTRKVVKGTVVALPKEFFVNLSDGRIARVTVAVVVGGKLKLKNRAVPSGDGGASAGLAELASHADKPGQWAGLPSEARVRETITDTLTGMSSRRLMIAAERHRLEATLARRIRVRTALKVRATVLTDFQILH